MNFTSIEQSKKLVELGIDKYTCDLIHRKRDCGDGYIVIVPRTNDGLLHNLNYFDERSDDIPCWSTGALIDLLPVEIEGFDFKKNGQYWSLSILEYFSYNDVYFKVKYGKGEIAFEEHKLIDALIDMIEWLKENKYL